MSVLTDREITRVLNRDLVIHPFDEQECLSPLGYDLRIGYAINLLIDGEDVRDGKIKIPSRTSIFVISKEHVWLSDDLIGTLHARGSLAAKGLFINATTVDPNWAGQMTFLIHNVSDGPVELAIGSRFVTMILHRARIPTNNAPRSNPKSVAALYGDEYGARFTNNLLAYLTTEENDTITRDFNNLVLEGRTPSIPARIWYLLGVKLNASQSLARKYFKATATIAVWILTVLAMIMGAVLIFVPSVWDWLRDIYGSDPTRLIVGITIIVAGLGVLIKDLAARK